MRYTLVAPPSGLSIGAKVGIAVGGAAAFAFALAALVFLIRRARRRRAQALADATIARSEIESGPYSPRTPISPSKRSEFHRSPDTPTFVPELPSPPPAGTPQGGERVYWGAGMVGQRSPGAPTSPQSGTRNPEGPISPPPLELPGSTFIHEHHPMYSLEGTYQPAEERRGG